MKLTTGQLLAYAAPTVALQAMLVPLYNFLPPVYYSAEVGMVALTVATLFAVGRFWEAIIDPLVGALSDRTKSRFGRRRTRSFPHGFWCCRRAVLRRSICSFGW